MIIGHIIRQRLNLCDSHVVADTIDYLEAKFIFRTDDWDGLDKWVHFAKDSAVYDIRLTDNCIRREDHLNLSAGMWKVYLHGNEFRDGKVIQRITTDEAVLYVLPTGTLDGEPFPEIPASETERINARLDELEKGGIGKPGEPGADGFSPSASVEQTDDGAVITLTDKDGTTTATITNGKDGQPGEKGDPGNDYVLTDADKQEIAGMIPGGGSGESDLIVTITENEDGTYTADHTYTEIGAALDAKRQVRVITHLGKVYYYRGSYLSAGAFFEFICYSATNQISFYRITKTAVLSMPHKISFQNFAARQRMLTVGGGMFRSRTRDSRTTSFTETVHGGNLPRRYRLVRRMLRFRPQRRFTMPFRLLSRTAGIIPAVRRVWWYIPRCTSTGRLL
ncbi:MAG: hypothetical protein J6C42_06545 [Clostridia bacterium]|nr:hypothetical protein [Clostridia bacterium]